MRLSPALLAAALLLTGFGCRPQAAATDPNAAPLTYEQQRAAEWLTDEPAFSHTRGADIASGRVTLTLRSKKGTTGTVTLKGPGIVGSATKEAEADDEGRMRFEWRVTRVGIYEYEGAVTFGREVVARFEGEGEAR